MELLKRLGHIHISSLICWYFKPWGVKNYSLLKSISNYNTLQYCLINKVISNSPVVERLVFINTNAQTKICWNCDKELKSSLVFCNYCNSLQPVNKHADFFQIIGVSHSYQAELLELRQKYRNLQTLLHPDKFSSKPKREQELSDEFSSIVNKAYATLLDPLERGLYMLSLENVSIEEGTTDVDKTFLMEIMERNEEIENESDPQKLNQFSTNNKHQLDLLVSEVAEAFDSKDIGLAKKLLTKMKYYKSIEMKIKEIKQKLNIPD